MRFSDYEFHFRWIPTLLLALPIPLFVGLGTWQLERADEKRALAETLRERARMPAHVVGALVADAESLRFRRLTARGQFEPEGQILLENRRHGGRTGFHVITPLRLEGSDVRVLVNRGWIPGDNAGRPTQAPVPTGTVQVNGDTHIPYPPALALHGGPDAALDWGGRWPYLTLELYRATVGYAVQPMVILQDPLDEGGFVRGWSREFPKEGMHTGYAIQWFAFAVIALLIYVRVSLVRIEREEVR